MNLDEYIEQIRKGDKKKDDADSWASSSDLRPISSSKKLNKTEQDKVDSLSEEDLQEIQKNTDKSEKKGILPSLYSTLEKATRPFHANVGQITQGITEAKQVIKQIVDDPSILFKSETYDVEKDKEMRQRISDARLKGWEGKEHKEVHDILKAAAPETMEGFDQWSEYDSTDFWSKKNLLSAKGLATRGLKLGEFVAGIPLDPLTYVPMGKPLEYVGKGAKGVGRVAVNKMIEIGSKISPKLTAEALIVANVVEDAVLHRVNKLAYFKKHLGAEIEDLFEPFRRKREVGVGKYQLLWHRLEDSAQMTSENQKILVDSARKMQDEAGEFYQDLKLKQMNLAADDLTTYNQFQEKIDKIKYLDSDDALEKLGPDAAQKMRGAAEDDFVKFVKSINKDNARGMASAVLEERGFKSLANTVAHNENVVNKGIATARLKSSKVLHTNLSNEIDKSIDLRQRFLKGEVKASYSVLKEDIGQAISSNKRIGKEMNHFINDKFDFSQDVVETNMRHLEKKIDGLAKYNLEQFDLKGAEKVANIKKTFDTLEGLNAKARKTISVAERKNILKLMSKTQSELNQQLKTFGKESVENIDRLSKTTSGSQAWASDAVNRYTDEINELVASKDQINKMMSHEAINYQNTVAKLDKIKSARAEQLHKNIKAYHDFELSKQAMKKFNAQKNAFYEESLKKNVPKELQPAARLMRKTFEEEGDALVKEGMIKGKVPEYFPSGVIGEGKELLFEKPGSRVTGDGSSFLKHRVFKNEAERDAWIKEANSKLPKNQQIQHSNALDEILSSHVIEAEGKLATKRLENAIFQKYNMKNWQDVEHLSFDQRKVLTTLRKEMDFIKGNGKIFGKTDNEFFNGAMAVYNATDRLFKKGLTTWAPNYKLMNIQGQPFLLGMNTGLKGFKPEKLLDGMLLKNAYYKGKDFVMNVKGKSTKIPIKELEEGINHIGMASGSFYEVEGLNSIKKNTLQKFAKKRMGRAGDVIEKIARTYTGIDSKIDEAGRFMLLSNYISEGVPIKEASKRVMKDMLDYNMLNSDVDNLMKGVYAFYSFKRRSLPIAIKALVKNPEVYSTFQRIVEKMSNREQLTQDELNSLNNYEKEQIIFTGKMINGVREMYSLGNTPVSDAYNSLNTIVSFNPKMFEGKLTLPVQALLDYYYNDDSFRGKEIGNELPDKYNAVMPESVGKALGLKKVERPKWKNGEIIGVKEVWTGEPKEIFMVRRLPVTSRIWNDVANYVKVFKDEDRKDALMDIFLNVSKGEINLEERAKFRALREKEFTEKKLIEDKGYKKGNYLYNPMKTKKMKRMKNNEKSQENTNTW